MYAAVRRCAAAWVRWDPGPGRRPAATRELGTARSVPKYRELARGFRIRGLADRSQESKRAREHVVPDR